jgi:hypothetical protein
MQSDKIIFKVLCGSHSYGLNTEKSDMDYRGVFITSLDNLFANNVQDEIILNNNNESYFELNKFLYLLSRSNPQAVELLFAHVDNILVNEPIEPFANLIANKDSFICKEMVRNFLKFGERQVIKSLGNNKKYKKEITKPNIMDYCWVETNEQRAIIPFQEYLDKHGFDINRIGLTGVDHFDFVYIHYDYNNEGLYSGVFGKHGDCLVLSSIPKGIMPIGRLKFSHDGYKSHQKDYESYIDWDKNKNMERYLTNMEHGKNYDSKNMMHNIRILLQTKSLLDNKTLSLRVSPEIREYLLNVKKGMYSIEECIGYANDLIAYINEKLITSDLPDTNGFDWQESLKEIRKYYYSV